MCNSNQRLESRYYNFVQLRGFGDMVLIISMFLALIRGLPNYISSLHFSYCDNMHSVYYRHLKFNISKMQLIIFFHIILLLLLNSLDWWMVPPIYQTARNWKVTFLGICSYLMKYNLYDFPTSPGCFLIFPHSLTPPWRSSLEKERYRKINAIYTCKTRLPFIKKSREKWKIGEII